MSPAYKINIENRMSLLIGYIKTNGILNWANASLRFLKFLVNNAQNVLLHNLFYIDSICIKCNKLFYLISFNATDVSRH